jgi:integrase
MALRRLTNFAVVHARPKDKGYEISDAGQRGLRLAVHPSGMKSWIVRYRHPITRVSRKMTLQPGLDLADARKLAADAMYQVAKGIDPIQAKRDERQAALDATEGTLNAVAKRYIDLAASKLRSRGYYESTLRNYVLPKLGQHPIDRIKRSEITAVLDVVERKSGASTADATKRVLNALMNWYESRSDFVNPMHRMKARLKPSEQARTRVLSDDELRAIWLAAGDERVGGYGQAIRLLVLTGGRRAEVSGLKRSEIEVVNDNGSEFTVWRLPARRSKSKREVMRPLSKAALDIINDMPIIGDSDYVFTLNGRSPMNLGYDLKKDLLSELSGVQGWVLHDLRRVHRSLLSRCRVPLEVAERALGHSQSLLLRTYDQHSHLPAMQEAVDKVAAEVARIVADERKGKVVRLRS